LGEAHGKLPIDDGVDVINVCGLTFKRYLDLAVGLRRRVAVVTDNDGKDANTVRERYSSYASHDFVSVHAGESQYGDTLEPQIVAVNDLAILNKVLGRDFRSKDDVTSYMKENKTDAALAIFESQIKIQMPGYILEAVR
jgi:predicted ATP-dependent endonuclease of OLD family